jgi:MarR family transcriptional regulator, transcriptional regulator for hemolysin
MHQKPPTGISFGPTGRIRRAHLSMQRYADALFSPRKITQDQCSLLWIVWRREGIRQNELAEELFTDPNTVTAMVVRLEKRGLIRREVCSEDGRARRVSLTPAGRRLVGRLREDWADMRQKLRAIFAGEAGQQALQILEQVCGVMTEERQSILESRKKSVVPRPVAIRSSVQEVQPAP